MGLVAVALVSLVVSNCLISWVKKVRCENSTSWDEAEAEEAAGLLLHPLLQPRALPCGGGVSDPLFLFPHLRTPPLQGNASTGRPTCFARPGLARTRHPASLSL